MRKISLISLGLVIFGTPLVTHGASSGIFSTTGKKGIVILNNNNTSDADFFWDVIKGQGTVSGNLIKKSIKTSTGQFQAECNRSLQVPGNSSCTLTFTKLSGNFMEIILDKENGLISAELTSNTAKEVGGQMAGQDGYFATSPDSKLSICLWCGDRNSQVHFTWMKNP